MNTTTIIPKEIITMHRGEKFLHADVLVTNKIVTKSFFGLKENITFSDPTSFSVYSPSNILEDSKWYYSSTCKYAPEITDFIYDYFKSKEAKKKAEIVHEDWCNPVKEVII